MTSRPGMDTPAAETTCATVPAAPSTTLLNFRRGWIATTDRLSEEFSGWHRRVVGELNVAVHPERDHTTATSASCTVLIIGWCVDTTAGSWAQDSIARSAVGLLRDGGWEGFLRCIAYLAGRFVVIATADGETRVIPDTVATVSAFGAVKGDHCWFASHAALVAEPFGAPIDQGLKDYLAEARRNSDLVVFRPGVRGDYEGVHHLLPNHYWAWRRSAGLQHPRFYPFTETTLSSSDGGLARFTYHFDQHIAAICDRPHVTVSLTAGFDSGASFGGFAKRRQPDSFTWTIVNPDTESHLVDARIARQRSEAVGVRHEFVPKALEHDPQFIEAAQRTYPSGMQALGFASTTFSGLPHDIVNIQSMLAEVGTGFYKNRPPRRPTAANLATTYTAQAHGPTEYARSAFADFIDYGQFTEDRFGPWSWYDLLYWESRAGLWSAARVSELELTHRVEMPYNSRHVLEALASGSWHVRQGRQVQRRYMDKL